MFSDFREHGSRADIETDLCIIGAGAAGITLAREFIGDARNVLVIESGNLEAEAATLDLNHGINVGAPYPPLESARLRFFGGSTNHWGGHCRPLDPIDFEARPWVPHSGWPISRKELDPYYARAHAICELGPYDYTLDTWGPALKLIDFDPRRVKNRVWQVSPPTRFGQRYREELRQAPNVHVLLNANAVDIVVNDAAKVVVEVAIRSLAGNRGRVWPKEVVLACGGIENPRLLLASNGVVRPGLGNTGDLVGRFFTEHAHALIGFAVPDVDVDVETYAAYYHSFGEQDAVPTTSAAGNAFLRVKPGLSEALQRAEQLPNACVDMGHGFDRSAGYLAFRQAGKAAARGTWPDDLGDALLDMLGDLEGLAGGIYRRLGESEVFWFGANSEPVPNPDSRVTLDHARDALGLPLPRLDWRLADQDKETTRRACRIVGEELARLGLARMRIDDWLLRTDGEWEDLGARYHQMGTTRMSNDPSTGVVDRHCRVHGIANLFVSGSSVFPTSGCANPTLTIVALAVRLADHLKFIVQ